MIRPRTLVIPGVQHSRLEKHLFPGDGKEAAAILLCSRLETTGLKLVVREALTVPHELCKRTPMSLSWPGEFLDKAVVASRVENLSIILLHSHPTGLYEFSPVDDSSDQIAVRSLILAGAEDRRESWHGSAIMAPGGAVKARVYDRQLRSHAVDLVSIYGENMQFNWSGDRVPRERPVAFGSGMAAELGNLSVAIVGVSGIGSIVAEQLLRMGVGELIVVDPDQVEPKNLNRILTSTKSDADNSLPKVEVFRAAAAKIRPETQVRAFSLDLGNPRAIAAVAEADIVFSCVDSLEGRHLCDRLATAMVQPLFDIGVAIPVRTPERGMVIANVCGRVDYVQPGGATLSDRRVYSPRLLEAEYLRRADPVAYDKRVGEGYMPGSGQQAPSVICVNMHAASLAVLEFVARAFPYRLDGNSGFAHVAFDLAANESTNFPETVAAVDHFDLLGASLRRPMLGLPALDQAS